MILEMWGAFGLSRAPNGKELKNRKGRREDNNFMCNSKTKTMRWLLGLSVLAVIVGMGQVAYGQAGVGGSTTPTFTSPLIVGETGAPATLAVHNSSTQTGDATFANLQMNVCKNSGTNFDGTATFSCTTGNDLSGILTFSATGTGTSSLGANATCVGTWTITTTGNHITFQGPSGPLVLSTSSSETCTISFTMGATAVPGGLTTGVAFGDAGATISAVNLITPFNTLTGTGTGSTSTIVESCAAVVDKQVSCDGSTWADVGLGTNNDDGTLGVVCPLDGFNGVPSLVHFQYFAQNTGGAAMTCGFTDSQNGTGGVTIFTLAAGSIPLAVGAAASQLNGTTVTESCTTTFAGLEPNTGLLTCSCPTSIGTNIQVTANDQATVDCKSAGVSLTKNCAPQSSGTNLATFTASNLGNVDLTACAISDTAFLTDLTCPPIGTGTTETVNGGTFGLAVGVTNFTTPDSANISGATANFCNTAHITCNAGAAQADSSIVCPVPPPGTCISRTPGYWGTHPTQTDSVLDGGLLVCGLTLTAAANFPSTANSAVEDLCENNLDARPNHTSDQQLQLIRQCTAAALNLTLSGNGGGITAGEAACSAFPNIATTFTNCCVGPTSTCDSGASVATINNSGCITTLDAFNNQFDTVSFPTGFVNENAEPTECSIATGNGFVNPGRNLGGPANGK